MKCQHGNTAPDKILPVSGGHHPCQLHVYKVHNKLLRLFPGCIVDVCLFALKP